MHTKNLINAAIYHKNSLDTKVPSYRFATRAYENTIKLLKSLPPIISKQTFDGLDLTDNMKNKLLSASNVSIETELQIINGIGKDKAVELVKAGVKSIKDLSKKKYFKMLPLAAQVYVKYNPEMRIPHSVIAKLENEIISDKTRQIIVGSYRRNSPTSKDVDIMLIGNDKDFKAYIKFLESKLKLIIYAQGSDKISTLVKVGNIYIKLDIFRCSAEEAPAMLLYSTGSKRHNIYMRQEAKKQGFILNQRGLFKNGKKIKISDEKGFFTVLNIPYKQPPYRN